LALLGDGKRLPGNVLVTEAAPKPTSLSIAPLPTQLLLPTASASPGIMVARVHLDSGLYTSVTIREHTTASDISRSVMEKRGLEGDCELALCELGSGRLTICDDKVQASKLLYPGSFFYLKVNTNLAAASPTLLPQETWMQEKIQDSTRRRDIESPLPIFGKREPVASVSSSSDITTRNNGSETRTLEAGDQVMDPEEQANGLLASKMRNSRRRGSTSRTQPLPWP